MRNPKPADFDVACPLCKAAPGRPCVSTGGHGALVNAVHRERRRAAEACGQQVFPEHPEWGPVCCNLPPGHDGPHAQLYSVRTVQDG